MLLLSSALNEKMCVMKKPPNPIIPTRMHRRIGLKKGRCVSQNAAPKGITATAVTAAGMINDGLYQRREADSAASVTSSPRQNDHSPRIARTASKKRKDVSMVVLSTT